MCRMKRGDTLNLWEKDNVLGPKSIMAGFCKSALQWNKMA